MKVKLTKAFEWSPDGGVTTQKLKAGEIVEGPQAEAAMKAGAGEATADDERTRPPFDAKEPNEPVDNMNLREMNEPTPGEKLNPDAPAVRRAVEAGEVDSKSFGSAPSNKAITTATVKKAR